MNQKTILLITCLVLCLLAPGVSANILAITPASVQHQMGETQSYTVILDSAPDGLSGFNITLGIENPAIAEIVGVSYPAWASMPKNSSVPSDSVWLKAVDLGGDSGTLNITFCTISVRADIVGITNITIFPKQIDDRNGSRYTPIIVPARLVVQSPAPPPPVANFAGTPTSGPAPLPVSFTDLSLNTPTGWAWFFGDENYTAPWTQMNTNAGWTARNASSSVAMPDGSIVLVGGFDDSGNKNDVWRSTDNGTTWTQMTASAVWTARASHSGVAMPDGSIVIMGGVNTGTRYNDVWRSTDNGATWTQQAAAAGWSARLVHSSVVMPDGSIVLMGGQDSGGNKNDTWRSMDKGATWTQMTAGAGWTARRSHSSVALPDGSIVLMGGYDGTNRYNDVWRSTDNGANWTQMTAGAGWSARASQSSVVMPDGSIVLMGGWNGTVYSNDAWRSTDNGATWTQMTAGAGWSARGRQSGIAMPDGSIVLMGGFSNSGNKNDVWRLMPAGSSARNPSHTYTAGGNYSVTLQAYNAGGYNSTRKTRYIAVTGSTAPITTTNPNFQIFDYSTTDTSGDSIIHGIQTVNKNRALNIWSENSSDQFAFSDVICSVTGSNIQNIHPEDHVIWNNSHIQWSYPEPEIYNRNHPLNFYWQTNATVPGDIPITVQRQVNKSIFTGPGYQLLTVNVTYENTTYGGIYSSIGTGFNQDMPFNATIVPGSFATDDSLLIRQYQPVNDHNFGFDLNMSRVVAGKSYSFSIVLFVEPKDAHGQPFEYKPRIDTQMGINTGHQEGGATTTATMPADLLPLYVTSATLSTNVSLNWSYTAISAVQAGLNEVFRNVSAGPYLVSGQIYYPGSETHPIIVNLFDQMPGPDIPPINSTQLFSLGRYSFPVENGTYYLNAVMDLNDNHQWENNEPAGLAINHTMRSMVDPVIVSGTDKTNIDITLFTTPYKITGTIYYFGNATGPIGLGAFLEPHAMNNASPYTGTWLESAGPYTLFVPNGTYFLRSSMDINRNFMHDAGEPAGYAINKTAADEPDAIVVNGANVTGVDIILFSQPQAGETLILPDISLPSGTRKVAPLFIANITNASGIGFVLTYTPVVLHITNITANTSLTGATLTYEINNSAGYVNVSLTTTSPITTVTAKGIVNIYVEARGSTGQQGYLSTNFAEWTDPEFDAFPLSVRLGTVRIEGLRGDFNHNGRVDIGDVTRVAYMAVGLVQGDIQADFNTNDIVDGGDAARIAWYYVGKIQSL